MAIFIIFVLVINNKAVAGDLFTNYLSTQPVFLLAGIVAAIPVFFNMHDNTGSHAAWPGPDSEGQ
jgi:hypothetical protein